tara:strand:- start:1854 stop:2210 length:357 start_codon:yes stop_codon:yes gene_type:complete
MAILRKRAVVEALNASTGVGGEWTVSTSGTAGSNAADTNTTHFAIAANTAQLAIHSAVEILFSFTATDTDINVSNADDLLLPANTLTFLTVPRGLGDTVKFNYISNSTTTGSVRIVEV